MKTFKLIFKIVIAAVLSGNSLAYASTPVTVYKSPTCGCCEEWAGYMRKNNFSVKTVNESDMSAIKKKYGMDHAASCHTALIGGYVVEGHVPAGAVNKLLKEKPDIVGISVPGMPQNSPGMGEMKKGTLVIYAIPKNGKKPYVFTVE